MSCGEIQSNMREWSMGVRMPEENAAHIRGCSACAAMWERERRLTAAFMELRREPGQSAASPHVASAMEAAFEGYRHGARGRKSPLRPLWALAAALILTVAGLVWLRSGGRNTTAPGAGAREQLYTGYFPLSAGASKFDMRDASHVIRIRLPRGEMRRFGLPVQEGFERLPVEADVVIGQDGIARAVRFVQ